MPERIPAHFTEAVLGATPEADHGAGSEADHRAGRLSPRSREISRCGGDCAHPVFKRSPLHIEVCS